MATIEFITKRIEGKKKEIAKLESKMQRILKAESTNWEVNPYYYHEDDKRWTMKDLETAKAALAKYEADLVTETEKESSRNVPAILEFLEGWKKRVTEYYCEGLTEYYAERKMVWELYEKSNDWNLELDARAEARRVYEEAEKKFRDKCRGYTEKRTYEWKGRTRTKTVKVRDGEYEYLRPYNAERTMEEAKAKLAKDLENEAKAKYDFIIERTNKIVGTITDASGLHVGASGDLNGIIKGDRGNARVNTIGAGGYNIQCFHFRTLIHKA